jgi:site-specific recombinase XerD
VIPVLPTDSPLAELAAAFSRSLRSRRKSPATIEVYVRAILEFDRFAVAQEFPRDADKIRRAHLEAFIEDQGTRLAPATASVRYTALGVFFKWLLEEQEIARHPFAGMEHPKIPDTMPKVISDDQVVALLKACEGPSFRQRRDRAILGIMVDTGCRRAEVATMTLDAIDLDQQTIRVTGKGSKTRTVFYSAPTGVALDRYMRVRDKHRARASQGVWLGANGPLTSDGIAEVVRRRSEMAGVLRDDGRPIHPHLLRHYRADRWMTNGLPLDSMLELGGWSDTRTALRYGRARRADRAIEAARRLFGETA